MGHGTCESVRAPQSDMSCSRLETAAAAGAGGHDRTIAHSYGRTVRLDVGAEERIACFFTDWTDERQMPRAGLSFGKGGQALILILRLIQPHADCSTSY
jgi:hypothetical protein